MKYIIDVPNEAIELMGGHISIFVEPVFKTGDCKHYALRLSKENIEPCTEPNLKAIETEVWDFARAINDMRYDDFVSCFDGKTEEQVYELFYSEVKDAYEAWKKQKEEIHVGDELINHIGKTYIIYDVDDHVAYGINLGKYPCTQECFPIRDGYCPKRTGRTFPEVAELVKKMRDAE